MKDQTNELLERNDEGDPDHPRRPLKLDQLAAQHRENFNAEARRAGQPELEPVPHRDSGRVDYGSGGFPQQVGDMTYAQRAMRGDFGEPRRQQAVEYYNRGDELQENEPYAGPLIDADRVHEADRPDGSQMSTRLHEQNPEQSNDLQTLASQQSAAAGSDRQSSPIAPGAAPASVTQSTPPVHVGGESSTASKTVHTVDATSPNKSPAGGTTTVKK